MKTYQSENRLLQARRSGNKRGTKPKPRREKRASQETYGIRFQAIYIMIQSQV